MHLVDLLSEDSLAIFLFHGVVNESSYRVRNYTRKHLDKDSFVQCVAQLKKAGHPMSMDEVVYHHDSHKPFPPRSFTVTFDDGFENNYSVAAPILADFGVPSTFYVSTDFICHNRMSWIDRIEYCFEAVPEGVITLPWNRTEHRFRSPEEQTRLLDHIRDRVKTEPSIDPDALVKHVFDELGMKEISSNNDPLDLKLDWKKVSELHRHDNFIIGGHGHRHSILAFLNGPDLEAEIKASVDLLKEKAGIAVRHYSYPEGLSHCYSDEVVQMLIKFGVACCPTAEHGINELTTSLFHLKRIAVT